MIGELFAEGPFDLLGDAGERGFEAETGFDTGRDQVESVWQLLRICF